MKLSALLATVLLATLPAMAGKVITYTATSTVSQEDANNAAIAGVSKQITSQVNSSQTMRKTEVSGPKGSLTEKYSATNNVESNLKLKNVKVEVVKTDGKSWKATATLDLDEYTADIQYKLNSIKADVAKAEADARKALAERRYNVAAQALTNGQSRAVEYDPLVSQLSKIYPVDNSFLLKHNLPEVENILIGKLSSLKIEAPNDVFELTKPQMPEWKITVTDSEGPVAGLPLVARQDKSTLLERRTLADGSATFSLRKVNFEKGPYEIIVTPNLPVSILKAAGLDQGVVVQYTVSKARCQVDLQCNQLANICNAVENRLSDFSVFSVQGEGDPEVTVTISTSPKTALKTGSTSLQSYNVSVTLKGDGIFVKAEDKGVGKNETDAIIKAIQKANFGSITKQLQDHCN